MVNRILMASLVGAVIACSTGIAHAQEDDVDDVAGWPDAGPPPQTSTGVGSSFGGVIGDPVDGGAVEMQVDSDTIGRVRFRIDQSETQCFNGDEFGVIYIDSVSGGFSGTSTFTDFTTDEAAAVSGGARSGTGGVTTADLTFPSGFRPDYAIVIHRPKGTDTALYDLNAGATHAEISGGTYDTGGCSFVDIFIDLADIGLSPGGTFRWIATAIDVDTGERADEAQGWTPTFSGNTTSPQTVDTFNQFQTVGRVLINEMDSNISGTEDDEFVELLGPPGTDLSGTAIVLWNGNGDVSYEFIDLDGESLDSSGFFVVGSAAVGPDVTLPTNTIQNGDGDAAAFYVYDSAIRGPVSDDTPIAGFRGRDLPRQDEWIDGVMDGPDTAVSDEVLASGEVGTRDFTGGSLQRCGPGRGVQSNYRYQPGAHVGPSPFDFAESTPRAVNNCSVCGDGTLDPIYEQCDDSDGLPRFEDERGLDGVGGMDEDCCLPDVCRFIPSGYECRSSTDLCDAPEMCTGSSGSCPADLFEGPSVVCREEAPGGCDVEETCNGLMPSCPVDSFRSASTVCRASAGACDPAETCTGSAAACPPNSVEAMGTVCRAPAGGCDVAEVCDGSSVDCPADALAMMGAVCRMEAGACDVAELCDGSSIDCPADAFLDATTVCRMATGACDVEELCTGTAAMCPMDMLAMDGASCDDGTACNGAETCMAGSCMSGTALDCDDSNLCTTDMCAEPGGCSSVAIPGCCNIDSDCDDGDICTADSCGGPGGSCTSSPITGCCEADADCDDGNACTTNTCDTATNTCSTAPVPGCCMADTDCDDGNSCTTDTCDTASGSCMNDAVAGCCMTDGDCNDDNTCTMDACDTATNTCTNDMLAGCCLDDDDCDDGDECTIDMCDTATAMCSNDRDPECGPDVDGGVDGGVGGDAGDPGMGDGGGRDSGTSGGADGGGIGGDAGMDETEGGCACRATAPSGSSSAWLLALGAIAFWRRRRRR